jgi:hypothetical protein
MSPYCAILNKLRNLGLIDGRLPRPGLDFVYQSRMDRILWFALSLNNAAVPKTMWDAISARSTSVRLRVTTLSVRERRSLNVEASLPASSRLSSIQRHDSYALATHCTLGGLTRLGCNVNNITNTYNKYDYSTKSSNNFNCCTGRYPGHGGSNF